MIHNRKNQKARNLSLLDNVKHSFPELFIRITTVVEKKKTYKEKFVESWLNL